VLPVPAFVHILFLTPAYQVCYFFIMSMAVCKMKCSVLICKDCQLPSYNSKTSLFLLEECSLMSRLQQSVDDTCMLNDISNILMYKRSMIGVASASILWAFKCKYACIVSLSPYVSGLVGTGS